MYQLYNMEENEIKELMQSIKGRLHSIESMGLLDGPGIRTVFFLQGCPLRCVYCHNPDTQAVYSGETVTPWDILEKAKRYRNYHGQDGGVTFSGGEPLMQGAFLEACVALLKHYGFSISVDTSGFGDPRYYTKIFPYIDYMLLDIKAFEKNSFYAVTKAKFSTYMDFINNLEYYGFKGQIWLRHVMMPGVTDDEASMREFIDMAMPLSHRIERIEILPYHMMGVDKYKEMKRAYILKGMPPMSRKEAKEFQKYANRYFLEQLQVQREERKRLEYMNYERGKKKQYLSASEKAKLNFKLDSLPLLNDLTEEERKVVGENLHLFRVEKGEFVFKAGDPADTMYIICQGHVKIYENSIDGREQIYYIYNDNDFIGGLNLLNQTSYIYTGQATDDCLIAAVPKHIFEKYMFNNPKILHRVLEKSFERIRHAEDLIQRLSTTNAATKVAALLLRLQESFGISTKEGIRLDLSINREEMGNYAGLTRETITRKLGEFKDLGYIEFIGNKVIIIKDMDALRSYCE